jgi:hypothetical protein
VLDVAQPHGKPIRLTVIESNIVAAYSDRDGISCFELTGVNRR